MAEYLHGVFEVGNFVFVSLILVSLAILKNYIHNWRRFRSLPGPDFPPLPLVGHLYRQRPGRSEFYAGLTTRLRENYISKGHEIGCVWFGTVPLIVVMGPNAAEVLLRSTKHTEKNFMYTFFHDWLRKGLLTSSGSKWTKRRKLLTPTFHFSILQNFLNVMNEQASILIGKLENHAVQNSKVDIFQPITLCALDIICETAMGTKINAQKDSTSDYVSAVNSISELIWRRIRTPWVWSEWVYKLTPKSKAYYRSLRDLHSFTRRVIIDRMDELNKDSKLTNRKRLAFLDLLLGSTDDGNPLSLQDVQEEVDTFMFEGHDTTSAGMSWAIYLIGSHPCVQTKLQREIDDILADDVSRPITMDDLKEMTYLDLVMKECLRQLPSVPIIGRITSCECIMDGHLIPEGTQCVIFPQLINNLDKYWPDPDKFDPERFRSKNFDGQHPYAYIPFSAGPRNCIGQKFALIEEKVIIVHLLRKFTVTSCDKKEDMKFLGDVILRPGSGVYVKLTPRALQGMVMTHFNHGSHQLYIFHEIGSTGMPIQIY